MKIIHKTEIKSSEYRIQLGKRLKSIRLGKDLKQDDISKMFGISKGSVSEYENGKNEPTPRFLVNYAKEFGINIEWLLLGSDVSIYLTKESESQNLVIRDISSPSKDNSTNQKLQEIITCLTNDKELMETVWHLVKARQGIKQISLNK